MRTFLIALVLAVVGTARAQEQPPAQATEGSATEPRNLPNTPTPKIEPDAPRPGSSSSDENSPCPAGVGKPCAFLGGRRYYPDLWHMTEHDQTWGEAMRHPIMIVTSAVLVGSTVFDIEGSDHCLAMHACSELNPLMPKSVNRPRQYATTMSLNGLLLFWFGRMKQHGKGNIVFSLAAASSLIHCYFGATGYNSDPPNSGAAKTLILSKNKN
jgi:hypothetical protein